MNFAKRIPHYRDRVESALAHWLPASTHEPRRLHEAMRYVCLGGGKRLRPLLMYATSEVLRLDAARVDAAAAAIEMIHCYSLVHDDLPAMDNDDLRRGRPTCHKAFDEATAILTGDALQTLAFEVLVRDDALQTEPSVRLQLLHLLAEASGSLGMAGGQAIDLAATRQTLNLAELENLHIHKTGALIRASVLMVCALAPQLPDRQRVALDRYAKRIGLAFQVQDDILDETGDTNTLGKTQGKDQAANKSTFPALMGLADAQRYAQDLTDQALAELAPFGAGAEPLTHLAQLITARSH